MTEKVIKGQDEDLRVYNLDERDKMDRKNNNKMYEEKNRRM